MDVDKAVSYCLSSSELQPHTYNHTFLTHLHAFSSSATKFWGFSCIYMPTPFNAEQPNMAW